MLSDCFIINYIITNVKHADKNTQNFGGRDTFFRFVS